MTASAYPRPFGSLTTVRAALSHLGESFSDQVREASVQLAPPNAPIPGDREVREAFWVLLPPDLQRQFFLRVAGDRRAWPRLKTLIGNPPYSFLRAEDEGVLRAGGICKRRARMAHAEPTATSYVEFRPHYEDLVGRQYRILHREGDARSVDERLPWADLASGAHFAADVRVRKRSLDAKRAALREGPIAAAGLALPRVGDVVALQLVPALRASSSSSSSSSEPLRARVVHGRQRAVGSPVARLVLKLV